MWNRKREREKERKREREKERKREREKERKRERKKEKGGFFSRISLQEIILRRHERVPLAVSSVLRIQQFRQSSSRFRNPHRRQTRKNPGGNYHLFPQKQTQDLF